VCSIRWLSAQWLNAAVRLRIRRKAAPRLGWQVPSKGDKSPQRP
jgi:hypothetical protein